MKYDIRKLKIGDPCPLCPTQLAGTLKFRYPGNDPESGPAELDCREGHLLEARDRLHDELNEFARDVLNTIIHDRPVDYELIKNEYNRLHLLPN